jgi:DNA invertase Pin-like site-specific DNA recombinase
MFRKELEREYIKDRIKSGLQRRRSEGKPMGRPKGSKDKGYRNKAGYYQRELDKRNKTNPSP